MAYGSYKNLAKRTESDNVLCDKAFAIANDPEYDRYPRGLVLMVYELFNENFSGSEINSYNQQFANELHTPFIRKFDKCKVYSSFRFLKFLLCAIDVYSKYVCVAPLKNKKSVTTDHAFRKIIIYSNCKLNKIWVDQGSEFYNKSFQLWLDDNDIETYSKHN